MKKFFAIILLISHINSSMFFPAVEQDDINTVVEFVHEEVLDGQDLTPADREDNNKPHYFSYSKSTIDISCPEEMFDTMGTFNIVPNVAYSEFKTMAPPPVSLETISPPPKLTC